MFSADNIKVRDALKAGARTGGELESQLARMQIALQRDISLHADKQIQNHADISSAFFDLVREAQPRPKTGAELVGWMLEQQGVKLDELDANATMGDVRRLGLFRMQMAGVAEAGGLDTDVVKKVRPDRLPSWQVEQSLRKHRQKSIERKGSEPNDAHLAGLAIYSDLTFVDKRTKDTLRQAIHAKSLPRDLLRRTEKNGPYLRALEKISSP